MKIACCAQDSDRFWAVVNTEGDAVTRVHSPFEAWAPAAAAGALGKEHLDPSGPVALSTVALRAPRRPTAKVVCVGLNYRSHVEAFGRSMPTSPAAFIKAPTAVVGPYDDIVYPRLTSMLDFELELAVVVASASGAPGTAGRQCSILGFTVANDVTARDLQRAGERGPDLYSAKSLDDTSPLGPWIVTADELTEQPDLAMTLRVNGEVRQSDRTSSMHWAIPEIIAYVDARSRLMPGDVVYTGTPAGVGLEDGRFLEVGDRLVSDIEGIGTLINTIRAPLVA